MVSFLFLSDRYSHTKTLRGIIIPVNIPKIGTINIHRGYAQSYRGLDSDLWAIYNEEFDKIGVTLHYVDEKLDNGRIILKKRVEIV